MDAFDQMIHAEITTVTGSIEPTADLWVRVQHGLRPRFRPGLAALAAATVLLLTACAFPTPRELVTNLALRVFHVGGVAYTVPNDGGAASPGIQPAAPQTGPAPVATVQIQDPGVHFTGDAPGQFPAAATAALRASAHPWRVPTWLPADMPVQVDLWEKSRLHSLHMRLGDAPSAIHIDERSPAPPNLDMLNGGAAEEIALAGVRALQVQTGDIVSFLFSVDDVQISVRGPARLVDSVRRVAESLAN